MKRPSSPWGVGALPVTWQVPAACAGPSLWKDYLVLLRGGAHCLCLTIKNGDLKVVLLPSQKGQEEFAVHKARVGG